MTRKLKPVQVTLTGETEKQIYNKKIIKKSSMNFHSVKDQTFEGIIRELEEVHHRTKFYSLFSGGKDSMTVAHKLSEMGKLEKIVHIQTNIGLQMTTDFVKEICEEYKWPLKIIEPSPKFTYASHIMQYGFPGPGFHRMIMGKLKYKTMRDFAISTDREEHCLISGVRKFESARRMGNYPYPIQNESALWFGCPIFYYSNEDVQKYVGVNNLKISPAYRNGLNTSGECLCGSFAGKGEKQMIRKLDSNLADYIEWLEDGILKFGTPQAKKYPKWGMQAKMSELDQQQQLDIFTKENPDLSDMNEVEGVVCGDECGAGTMRGMLDY